MRRFFSLILCVGSLLSCKKEPIKALIVSGQNNHNWQVSHLVLKQILDDSPGPGGNHGSQRSYVMHGHNTTHPIVKDLPLDWTHAKDELYDKMRGPANIKDLLYSASSDVATGGSGREEPLVFTVDYHDARILHLMIGHCGPNFENNPAMQCIGFQTLLLRGAEWAATGKVTQKVPKDFPYKRRVL